MLMEIPYDRKLAEAYSRGEMAARALDDFHALFGGLLESIMHAGVASK